jgi:P-type conjugative transfer protein TrbJ
MHRRQFLALASTALLALWPCVPVWASGWPVFDAGNFGQNLITAGNSVKQVANQARQIENEVTMIRNQIRSIEHQVRNLQRLDITSFNDLVSLGNRLTSLLNTAQGIAFNLADVQGQFERIYRFSTGNLTPAEILARRREMLQQARYSQVLSVKVQSIQTSLTDTFARLGRLLSGSYTAQGNLDAQQVAHQQRVLQHYSNLQLQQMQAAALREMTLRHAEETVLKHSALLHYQEKTTLAPVGDWRTGPQLEMGVRGSLR